VLTKHPNNNNNNNNNNNSILYYLCAESTATRPVIDTVQCRYIRTNKKSKRRKQRMNAKSKQTNKRR
jgi:hypothetical protein